MLTLLKVFRNLLKAISSSTAPWQIALGAWFGVMLGFLPIFPSAGPSPLGMLLLVMALLVNCHLASFLLFLGVGKLVSLALTNVAVAIGDHMTAFAQACADIGFLHSSHWSHTGWLGMTILGIVSAPLVAIAMYIFTLWFRTKVQPKLEAKRKLMLAGRVAGNGMMFKLICWFMGL